MNAPITVLYFAWLRERLGTSQEDVTLPDGIRTVAQLVDHLAATSPRHASVFENRRTLRCAINQEFADFGFPVEAGDEIAFFPPITGG